MSCNPTTELASRGGGGGPRSATIRSARSPVAAQQLESETGPSITVLCCLLSSRVPAMYRESTDKSVIMRLDHGALRAQKGRLNSEEEEEEEDAV